MMKISYIYHDCFLVETDSCAILFDYWKDVAAAGDEKPLFLSRIDMNKPFYVIVSHHHKDHFTRKIFDWSIEFPEIRYILSKDVAANVRHILRPESLWKGVRPAPESVVIMRVGDKWRDACIAVRAYGSTDIGNSYLVEVDGYRLFHAGDLNAWVWKDESTKAEIAAALRDFREKILPLKEEFPRIDVAFFPVDSRIGRDYWEGAKVFVREIAVSHFIPMHFTLADNEVELVVRKRDACAFDCYANPGYGDYVAMTEPYACFAPGLPLAASEVE